MLRYFHRLIKNRLVYKANGIIHSQSYSYKKQSWTNRVEKITIQKMPLEIQELLSLNAISFNIGTVALKTMARLCPPLKTAIDDQALVLSYIRNRLKVQKKAVMFCHSSILGKDTNKIHKNFYRLDRNSAYPYILVSNKMPVKYLRKESPDYVCTDDEIAIYEDMSRMLYFDKYPGCIGMYIFKAEYIDPDNIYKRLYDIARINKEYKGILKKFMNSSIGAIHSFSKSIIAQYVWHLQKTTMIDMLDRMINITDDNNYFLFGNTDSFAFCTTNQKDIPKLFDNITIGSGMGEFKYEHYNTEIKYWSASKYHIKDNPPVLTGYSWKVTNEELITVNGVEVKSRNHKLLSRGDKIKCKHGGKLIEKRI